MSFSLHTDVEKVMLFISTVFKFNSEIYTPSESVKKTEPPASSHPRRTRMSDVLVALLEALGIDIALRELLLE